MTSKERQELRRRIDAAQRERHHLGGDRTPAVSPRWFLDLAEGDFYLAIWYAAQAWKAQHEMIEYAEAS